MWLVFNLVYLFFALGCGVTCVGMTWTQVLAGFDVFCFVLMLSCVRVLCCLFCVVLSRQGFVECLQLVVFF